jgi:methionine synthase II (cobalamin-independent)
MALKTTCIGAFPKPDYVPVDDWFNLEGGLTDSSSQVTRQYTTHMNNPDAAFEELFQRATKLAIDEQVSAGIDIPTDGEMRRENYVHYQCRHLKGFDFENLTKRVVRDGAYTAEFPTIRGRIEATDEHFLDRDFKIAQSFTDRPVKITVPGPITIMDTTVNSFYDDERALAFDLADGLNSEIRVLAAAGCKYIQVDEPLFARNVDAALDYGIECLDRCFDGVPEDVTRVMHMCCGYPGHLDDVDYHKADPGSYFRLAKAIDASSINQVSIEDAHRHNEFELLEHFTQTTVILGVVAIAQSKIETVEEITTRLKQILHHIDADRLIAAPDCGLGILGHDLAIKKLKVLCTAAHSI